MIIHTRKRNEKKRKRKKKYAARIIILCFMPGSRLGAGVGSGVDVAADFVKTISPKPAAAV